MYALRYLLWNYHTLVIKTHIIKFLFFLLGCSLPHENDSHTIQLLVSLHGHRKQQRIPDLQFPQNHRKTNEHPIKKKFSEGMA